jgi:hypothetical protein
MKLLKKNRRKCELHHCGNILPEEPGVIRIGEDDDYVEFTVCDECVKLMEVLEEKITEMQARKL